MELSVRLVTMPRPGIRTKVLIFVIIIVTLLLTWGTGQELVSVISLILGSGIADAPAARTLLTGEVLASRP